MAAAVAIAVLAVLPSAAAATTIPVTGTGDGITSDGHCSLREAIQAANTDAAVNECPAGSGADTVTVPAGTYTLAIDPNFNTNDDNTSGDLDLNGNLTITGAGAGATVINGDRKDRVLRVHGGTAALNGLTITGGQSKSNPVLAGTSVSSGEDGGGISNLGTLTLTDCEITDNATEKGGNGVMGINANAARGGRGGGISSGGTLILRRTIVSRNRTGRGGDGTSVPAASVGGPGSGGSGGAGGDGGGVAATGPLTIDQSVIEANATGIGGTGGAATGAAGTNTPSGGAAGAGGIATGGQGGAGGPGGGVWMTPVFGTPTMTITNTTIAGNFTGSGGTGGNATGGAGGHASTTAAGGPGGAATGGAGGDGGQGGGLATDISNVSGSGDTFSDNRTGNGGPSGSGTGGTGGNGTASSGSANGGKGGNGSGAEGGNGGHGGGVDSSHAAATFTNATWSEDSTGSGGGGGAGFGGAGGTGAGASGSGGVGGDAQGGNGGDGGPGGAAVFLFSSPNLTHVTIAGDSVGQGAAAGSADDGAGGANAGSGTAATGQSTAGGAGTGNVTRGIAVIAATGTISNSVEAEAATGCSGLTDAGHNVTSDATCPGTVADPKLGALQDNGGPTPTRALKAGSAAIDAVPAAGASCSATDQRGVSRPRGAACDAGAYEVAAPDVTAGGTSGVGQRKATVAGAVNPHGRPTQYFFELRTGTSPAIRSPAALVGGGLAPVTVRATFTGLKPATTYRYRVLATSADGTTTGSERSFTTKPLPPVFLSAKVFPATFAIDPKGAAEKPVSGASAPKGTTFTYKLSAAARVVFKIELTPKGKPAKLIGRFAQRAKAGTNTKRFSGRIGKKSLKPGSYRATLVATDAVHQSSQPKRLKFKVVKG